MRLARVERNCGSSLLAEKNVKLDWRSETIRTEKKKRKKKGEKERERERPIRTPP